MNIKSTIHNLQFTKKGVSIYLALVVMLVLIAIGLGITMIIVFQLRILKGVGDSVVAFYAADSGMEHSLYNRRNIEGETGAVSGNLSNNAAYVVTYEPLGSDDYWKSVGSFSNVKRAIEISIPTTLDFVLTSECDGFSPCTIVDFCRNGGWGSYDFDLITIDATLVSGNPDIVNFYTDGTYNPVTECYDHTLDGFGFEACFSPSFCTLNCPSILDLDMTAMPPAPASAVGPFIVYAEVTGVLTEQITINVSMKRLITGLDCPD
jgi:hypothetical protein